MSAVFNDQDNVFETIKLTKLDSISVTTDPSSDNELANRKYVDDSLRKGTFLRFNRSLQNYLKVSVGHTMHILKKNLEQNFIDTTKNKVHNQGGYLLEQRNIGCNDKNINGKIQNFILINKKKFANF